MPTKSQELESGEVSFGDLLSENALYQVPLYQRNYVWGEGQIEELWKDIDELLEGTAEVRFLGALVFQLAESGNARKPTKYIIIDGQQRVTTMFLLATAMASIAQEQGYAELSKSMATGYLLSDKRQTSDEPKLIPAFPDYKQFNEVLSFLENPKPSLRKPFGKDTGNLADAFLILCEGVRERTQRISEQLSSEAETLEGEISEKALMKFEEVLTEGIQFIEITLDERHDPNEVFHRLNTAGLPLDVADLVRNEVFRRIQDELDEADKIYHQDWIQFETSLGEFHNRYFWPFALAENPSTTRSRMFKDLQNKWEKNTHGMEGPAAAQSIIKDLNKYVASYLAVAANDRPRDISGDAWDSLTRLSRANLPTVAYPFFLPFINSIMAGEIDENKAIQTFEVIESFLVRRALCGHEPTGLHAVFKDLWKNSAGDPTKVREKVVTKTIIFPTDEMVEDNVLLRPMYSSKIAPFILAEYERSLQGNQVESFRVLPVMTIDHVMPQDRSDAWTSVISEDAHERLKHTWGNLVPLSQGANSSKKSKGWRDTKDLLTGETKFETVKEILKHDVWDEESICTRSKSLSKWAIGRWPDTF
jgi:hypothetical protein